MSAIDLTIASLNPAPHWVEFQLLKPIGGVRAKPLASALAGDAVSRAAVAAPARAMVVAAHTATSLRVTRTDLLLVLLVAGRGNRHTSMRSEYRTDRSVARRGTVGNGS